MKKKGIVYLVGAGPGDAGLITVKGMNKLREADVVLYDNLANSRLLSECPAHCEIIFAGKESGHHYVEQNIITELLIRYARKGKKVVRLKGGDPLIFGRGSEEAKALYEAGIEFEIIPGVTAATGVSAYSGIPLTHRNKVVQTVFVTAHEKLNKRSPQVDWQSLGKLKNTTIVIYMGVSQIQNVVNELINAGMKRNTPAAVVEKGTLSEQRTFSTTIAKLPQIVKSNNIRPPSIFIIGDTVNSNKSLNWFESKPLFGKRIVCTRAEEQAQSLINALVEKGAIPIPFSTIKTELSKPKVRIKSLISSNKFDWLIFSSENGVKFFFDLLSKENADSRILNRTKIAVVGTSTGIKLKDYGLIPDFIPNKFTAESLLKEITKKYNLNSKNILRVKGDFRDDTLSDGLIKSGAKVTALEVYKTIKVKPLKAALDELMNSHNNAYLFTSKSTVKNFFEILNEEKSLELLNNSKTLAIGPVTADELKGRGVKKVRISKIHTIDGMVEELVRIMKNK